MGLVRLDELVLVLKIPSNPIFPLKIVPIIRVDFWYFAAEIPKILISFFICLNLKDLKKVQ